MCSNSLSFVPCVEGLTEALFRSSLTTGLFFASFFQVTKLFLEPLLIYEACFISTEST